MGYNLLINGCYNPLTNLLLTSWDIQVKVTNRSEKWWLGDYFPFGKAYFQGLLHLLLLMIISGRVYWTLETRKSKRTELCPLVVVGNPWSMHHPKDQPLSRCHTHKESPTGYRNLQIYIYIHMPALKHENSTSPANGGCFFCGENWMKWPDFNLWVCKLPFLVVSW